MGKLGLTHQVWCILLASRVHAERREEVMKYSRARTHTHTQHTGALSGFGEPGRHEELRRFSKVPLSTFCYVMGLFFSHTNCTSGRTWGLFFIFLFLCTDTYGLAT